jgi:hypothetical protein
MKPCKLWHLSVDRETGYGRRWDPVAKRPRGAHVMAWEAVHGPVPPGFDVHHVCETRACVEQTHLHLVAHDQHPKLHAATRTHCRRGHAWDPVPNGVQADGTPRVTCRACRRMSNQRS